MSIATKPASAVSYRNVLGRLCDPSGRISRCCSSHPPLFDASISLERCMTRRGLDWSSTTNIVPNHTLWWGRPQRLAPREFIGGYMFVRTIRRLLLVVLAGSAALMVGVPAHADPSDRAYTAWYCGDACNRTDPDSYKVSPYQTCASDAKTVSSYYNSTHGVTLQLRYSPYCRTVWGRIYGGRNQNYYVSLQRVFAPGDVTTLYATREVGPPSSRSYSWSYQWNDANVAIRACVSTSWSTESPWLMGCTNPY